MPLAQCVLDQHSHTLILLPHPVQEPAGQLQPHRHLDQRGRLVRRSRHHHTSLAFFSCPTVAGSIKLQSTHCTVWFGRLSSIVASIRPILLPSTSTTRNTVASEFPFMQTVSYFFGVFFISLSCNRLGPIPHLNYSIYHYRIKVNTFLMPPN